jgi:hypothetical protein
VEKPVNITLENSWLHQHLIIEDPIEDPIEITKKKYKGGKGRRITKVSLEKFKNDSRFNLLVSNAGNKMLCLPETIIESILEFSGLVSTHKDYRLVKFGLHESENKMQELIKKWIIKQIIACSNERFIIIMEYFRTVSFSKELKKNIFRFIEYLKYLYRNYEGDDLASNITTAVWWERAFRPRCRMERLLFSINKEPLVNFNRHLIDNMP